MKRRLISYTFVWFTFFSSLALCTMLYFRVKAGLYPWNWGIVLAALCLISFALIRWAKKQPFELGFQKGVFLFLISYALGHGLFTRFWYYSGMVVFRYQWDKASAQGFKLEHSESRPKDNDPSNAVNLFNRLQESEQFKDLDMERGLNRGAKKILKDSLQAFESRTMNSSLRGEAANLVRRNDMVIQMALKIAKAPKVNWGIDHNVPHFKIEVPQSSKLFLASKLIVLQAELASENGSQEVVKRNIRAALQLASMNRAIESVVGTMGAVAVEKWALQAASVAMRNGIDVSQEMETLSDLDTNVLAWRRVNVVELLEIAEFFSRAYSPNHMDWLVIYEPLMPWDAASGLSVSVRLLEAERSKVREFIGRKEEVGEDRKDLWLMSSIGTPNFGDMYVKAAAGDTLRRMAISAAYMMKYRKKHGAYPSGVTELSKMGMPGEAGLDLFSGRPLAVGEVAGHPVIYSVGPDLKDDGGLIEFDWTKDKGDLVWTL
jgi:hypothetical protein